LTGIAVKSCVFDESVEVHHFVHVHHIVVVVWIGIEITLAIRVFNSITILVCPEIHLVEIQTDCRTEPRAADFDVKIVFVDTVIADEWSEAGPTISGNEIVVCQAEVVLDSCQELDGIEGATVS
jgi:hypothetical protein